MHQLPTTPVEGERDMLQWTGTTASNIAQYIAKHPDEGEALTLALAMIQGPKAVIQLAVGSVISQTQAGQEAVEYAEVARNFLGKVVAEYLEGSPLDGGESDGSYFLIGGGKLIVDVLMGAVSTSRGGRTNTVPDKTPSEHIAQNSKGPEVPNKQPDKSDSERDPCCFAAGTMVATPAGDRAIETLKVGDVVWTKPEHGSKPFAAAILKTYQRNDQPIYKLTLESTRPDGEVKQEALFVTPSHPFYVPAQRDFVPMIELKIGELLRSLDDGAGEGTSSRVVSVELYKPVGETFNLTVDIGHTFYVGDLKTWVHNTGPCRIDGNPKKEETSQEAQSEGSNTDGAKGVQSIIEPKIAQQMGKRGWTTDSLESVIANPSKTVVTKDTRFDPVSGTRLNDPATGYVAKDGSYVVRNDRTGAIVQVSDKNDKNWVAPWE